MTMTEQINERIRVAKARTKDDGHRRVVYMRSLLSEISPTITSRLYYERNEGIHEDDLCASVFMSGEEVHAERYEVDTYVPKAYRA